LKGDSGKSWEVRAEAKKVHSKEEGRKRREEGVMQVCQRDVRDEGTERVEGYS